MKYLRIVSLDEIEPIYLKKFDRRHAAAYTERHDVHYKKTFR